MAGRTIAPGRPTRNSGPEERSGDAPDDQTAGDADIEVAKDRLIESSGQGPS